MEKVKVSPWEVGAIFICTKCGAKFNQENLAEEVKSEVRKQQKAEETQKKIRVMTSGCLGVCYPEKQTIAFMPTTGATELSITELDKDKVRSDVLAIIKNRT